MADVTLLTDLGVRSIAGCEVSGGSLWLREDDLPGATGFVLKPEGLCRDDVCFPLPPGREDEFAHGGRVNVAAFWRHRGAPVLSSRNGDAWVLGEPAGDRAQRMLSLEAPDFTLPDVSGTPHSLSDYRGKKVLLATWASW
jgi:hypothetical protein